MSFTIFDKSTGPSVGIKNLSLTFMVEDKIRLNKACSDVLAKHGVSRVLLMWDPDTNRIGITAAGQKDDQRSYAAFAKDGYSAIIAARAFIRFIGFKCDQNLKLEAVEGKEALLECTIPAKYLTPTDGGNFAVKS